MSKPETAPPSLVIREELACVKIPLGRGPEEHRPEVCGGCCRSIQPGHTFQYAAKKEVVYRAYTQRTVKGAGTRWAGGVMFQKHHICWDNGSAQGGPWMEQRTNKDSKAEKVQNKAAMKRERREKT